jgi:catechol 2,3-dioxygenase-like lactoylglutathione lyase family enzyme
MAGERMYPILPCPDLAEAVEFYGSLGFVVTYRQEKPNPCAVVQLEDMAIHLAGVPGYEPESSPCSVIVTVPDAERLRSEFAAGLRASRGRVPVEGIPRLLRLRRKAGSAVGFSVIDTGGIWLRFYQEGSEEETATTRRDGLARMIDVAARQGEARGEDGLALAKVTAGLDRYADAPVAERIEAQVYRAELLIRLGRAQEARSELDAVDALITESGTADYSAETLLALRTAAGPAT